MLFDFDGSISDLKCKVYLSEYCNYYWYWFYLHQHHPRPRLVWINSSCSRLIWERRKRIPSCSLINWMMRICFKSCLGEWPHQLWVCTWPPVLGGFTVKCVTPITSSPPMTSSPYPDNPVILPLRTPGGDWLSKGGSSRFLHLGFWDSEATAGGLCHNLLGSCPRKSSHEAPCMGEGGSDPPPPPLWHRTADTLS